MKTPISEHHVRVPFNNITRSLWYGVHLTKSHWFHRAGIQREQLLTPELVQRSVSRPRPLYPKEIKPRYQLNCTIFNGRLHNDVSPKRFGSAEHAECQAANKERVKPSSRPASSMTTVGSASVGCFLLWPIRWSLAAVTSGLWAGDSKLEMKLQPSATSWLIQAHCFPPLALLPQPATPFVVVLMLCLTAVWRHRSQIRL